MKPREIARWLFVILFLATGLMVLPAARHELPSLVSSPPANAQEKSAEPENGVVLTTSTFRTIASKVKPHVVNISSTRVLREAELQSPFHFFLDPFSDRRFGENAPELRQQSLGSGFVIDDDGHVVTNYHVIEKAEEIKVITLSNKEFDAELIGKDSKTDIALLKVKGDLHALTGTVEIGDSARLEVGDWVMAVGNPFALGHTVTVGVVSAMGRTGLGIGPYEDFIQTDASINPGNSGGPLVDITGKVVGINTAIYSRTGQSAGIGFAIPINMAGNIISQLKKTGKVVRGWLGVEIQEVGADIASALGLPSAEGALVVRVTDDSPAAKSGLQAKDVIVGFDGKAVSSHDALPSMVAALPPGAKVKVDVVREGQKKQFNLVLGVLPEEDEQPVGSGTSGDSRGYVGIEAQTLTADLAKRLGLEEATGVLITDVDPRSPAARAKPPLRRGDVILEVNQKKVADMEEYRAAVAEVQPGDAVLFFIRRPNGGSRYVAVKAEEAPRDE
ncbi:MAG: DegQ family serine endoprotease [Candidatus Schekmanbacteria bacterium]|nr:DegQ family serine endoprotease [Candidatus Schekmanbacteria bacterium]